MRATTLLTAAAVTVLCTTAVLSAVIESFLVPYEIVPAVSVSTLLAVPANLALTRAGRDAAGAAWGGVVPALAWVLVVVLLGATRAEGDLVVPGSAGGLLFMLAGTLAAVVGVARRTRPPTTSPNGPSPEGSSSG